MTIFSCSNLSKKFDREYLFENISFGLSEGERLGIIGKNGIGKTTLLRIIGNYEEPDTGEVVYNNNVRVEYLAQQTDFTSNFNVLDAVMQGKPDAFNLLEEHHSLVNDFSVQDDEAKAKRLLEVTHKIDEMGYWNLETEAKIILSRLGVEDFDKRVNTLSGGQKKRVALAKVLLSNPELLILDEPTNHLDADSVQWLQDRLMNTSNSLVFITHDRYFLDSVSTRIIEIDQKRIYSFVGNYESYLEKKESIIEAHNSAAEHNKSKLRMELAWLQKGAKARRTKAKSRIDWISKMEETTKKIKEKKIKIELGTSFLGQRIIDANYITKSIGGQLLFKDFVYIAKPKDRIGIIGPNGCGKSTLLNVLAGNIKIDAGSLKLGDSIKIGYYKQEINDLDEKKSLVASIREIADYIDCGVGRDRYLTPKDLLLKFNFPPEQHSSLVETLSGGERRRLALIRMLIANPNVIFLDEPTNDLDIQTLTALEEYLDDFYGVLLVVSHDRAFLDRTVEFIWSFEENGKIKEYPGNYSFYLQKKEEALSKKRLDAADERAKAVPTPAPEKKKSNKRTYAERLELEKLEAEIPALEEQKSSLEEQLLQIDPSEYKQMEAISNEINDLCVIIEEKTNRWLEISEKPTS